MTSIAITSDCQQLAVSTEYGDILLCGKESNGKARQRELLQVNGPQLRNNA